MASVSIREHKETTGDCSARVYIAFAKAKYKESMDQHFMDVANSAIKKLKNFHDEAVVSALKFCSGAIPLTSTQMLEIKGKLDNLLSHYTWQIIHSRRNRSISTSISFDSDKPIYYTALWKDNVPQIFTSETGKSYKPINIARLNENFSGEDLQSAIKKCIPHLECQANAIDEVILLADSSTISKLSQGVSQFFGGKQLSLAVDTNAVCEIGAALLAFCVENIDIPNAMLEEDVPEGQTASIHRQWKQLQEKVKREKQAEHNHHGQHVSAQEEKLEKEEIDITIESIPDFMRKMQDDLIVQNAKMPTGEMKARLTKTKKELNSYFKTIKQKQTGAELTPQTTKGKISVNSNKQSAKKHERAIVEVLHELVDNMQKQVKKEVLEKISLQADAEERNETIKNAQLKIEVLEKMHLWVERKQKEFETETENEVRSYPYMQIEQEVDAEIEKQREEKSKKILEAEEEARRDILLDKLQKQQRSSSKQATKELEKEKIKRDVKEKHEAAENEKRDVEMKARMKAAEIAKRKAELKIQQEVRKNKKEQIVPETERKDPELICRPRAELEMQKQSEIEGYWEREKKENSNAKTNEKLRQKTQVKIQRVVQQINNNTTPQKAQEDFNIIIQEDNSKSIKNEQYFNTIWAYQAGEYFDYLSLRNHEILNEEAARLYQQAQYYDFCSMQEAAIINEAVARAIQDEEYKQLY